MNARRGAASVVVCVLVGLIAGGVGSAVGSVRPMAPSADRAGGGGPALGPAGPPALPAQEVTRCAPAERFLSAEYGMATVVEADTIDDWRTGRALPGCRITAAGTTARELSDAAAELYRRLREGGWSRTPNPADAPGESSLRFRLGETDCLFNVYSGVLLGSRAELEVSAAAVPEAGERRINVLVLCTAALDAPGSEGRDGAVAPSVDRALSCSSTRSPAEGSGRSSGHLRAYPFQP